MLQSLIWCYQSCFRGAVLKLCFIMELWSSLKAYKLEYLQQQIKLTWNNACLTLPSFLPVHSYKKALGRWGEHCLYARQQKGSKSEGDCSSGSLLFFQLPKHHRQKRWLGVYPSLPCTYDDHSTQAPWSTPLLLVVNTWAKVALGGRFRQCRGTCYPCIWCVWEWDEPQV